MRNKNFCLSIDTTSVYLGLALLRYENKGGAPFLVKSFFQKKPLAQSEFLFPSLTKLLKAAKVKKTELSLIAVNAGPGSFTGVRVGISSARALSQGLGIPAVGVSVLEAMARDIKIDKKKSLVITMLPALSNELYFAAYQMKSNKLSELTPPCWKHENELEKFVIQQAKRFPKVILFGEAKRIPFGGALPSNVKILNQKIVPRPELYGEIGIERYLESKSKKKFSYPYLVPLYLQPSWAERKSG